MVDCGIQVSPEDEETTTHINTKLSSEKRKEKVSNVFIVKTVP